MAPVADASLVLIQNNDRRSPASVLSTLPGLTGTARRSRSRLLRGSGVLAVATALSLAAAPSAFAGADPQTSPVEFTGDACNNSLAVPAGVEQVTIVARGAAGGGDLGGKGMQLTQQTDVTPGETLTVCVGTDGGSGGDGRFAPGNAGGGLARVLRYDAGLAEHVDLIIAPGGGGQGTADDAGEVAGFGGGDAGTPMQAWAGEGFGPAGGAGASPFDGGAGGSGSVSGQAGQTYAGGAGASDLGIGGSGGGGGGAGAYGGGGGGTWEGQSGSGGGGGSAACSAACDAVPTTDKTAAVTISWAEPKTPTTTTLTQAPAPVDGGASVTLTATVAPESQTAAMTGTVAFSTADDVIDSCASVAVVNDQASCTITAPTSRYAYNAAHVAARYSGDETYAASGGFASQGGTESSHLELAVVYATPFTLEADSNVRRNNDVNYTAYFDQSAYGGTISFTIDGAPIADCTEMPLYLGTGRRLASVAGIQVTCATKAPATGGDHLVAATYSGTARDQPSAASTSMHVIAPRVLASPLAFASTAVGTPVEQVITITNDGDDYVPFTLAGASLRGADAADFAIVEDRCAEGYIGQEPRMRDVDPSCTVTVRFTPTAASDRSAQLVLVSEREGETFAFTLVGTTPAPVPAQAPKTEQPAAPKPVTPAAKPVTGAILAPAAAGAKTQGTITPASRLTLPLNCPTWMPCTVSGRVITDAGIVGKKGSSGKRRVRHLIAFKGVKIGNGKTVKVSRKVGASAVKLARRNKRKTIKATLVINTVLQDGTKFETRQPIKLAIGR